MHPFDHSRPSAALSFEIKLLIAALFWVGGYAVLALRAALSGDGGQPLFSEARLVATLAGTALLLAVMLLWERVQGSAWLPRLAILAGAVLLACAAMFVVRLATAQIFGLFGPNELADSGRWLIAWSGYFLAAVTSFIAFAALRHARTVSMMVALPSTATAIAYPCADDISVLFEAKA